MELIYRQALLERAKMDTQARTVPASLSSETPVPRRGVNEILSHAPDAVDLTRAKDGLPLLFAHDQAQPIGIVESVALKDRKLTGVLRFGASPKADEVFQDVAAGVLRNVSIGYAVLDSEPVDDGILITRWQLYESSIVSVPGDPSVGINRSFNQQESTTMQTTAPEATETREQTIHKLAKAGRMDTRYADELIRSNCTVDEARTRILDRLATESERYEIRSQHDCGYSSDPLAPEVRTALMSEALAYRYGGPPPSEAAKEFMNLRIPEMARQLLELRGIRTAAMNASKLVERALHSTSDFPNLVLGAGNRILRQAYQSYAGGLKRICRASTAPDFRAKNKLMLGEAPSLEKVNESGEFTSGSIKESKETYQLVTYGRVFAITRQAMVNDDLAAFTELAGRFGRAAAERESSVLAALISSNPVMSDSIALFHASHGNLAAAGGAISVTTLGAARLAMRLQKGLDGTTPIDASPKFLVVPAALETVAEQTLTTIAANQVSNVNPFPGKLELVVDPRLDAASATAWYLAADPSILDTIEYAYLEGEEGPQIFTREGFEVEGLETKCRLDFGAGVLDHRGLYRNPGA